MAEITKTKDKPTPAPWEWSEGGTILWGRDTLVGGTARWQVLRTEPTEDAMPSDADRRLIVAAPRLLMAAQMIAKYDDLPQFGDLRAVVGSHALSSLQDAIRRAEG